MSLATLKTKVEQLIEKAQNDGGGGEAEGLLFLERDEIFHGLPKKVELTYLYSGAQRENVYAYAFASGNNGLFSRMVEVVLPNGLTWIGDYMFSRAYSLKTISADLTQIEHIGSNAFEYCLSLTELPYMPKLIDVRPKAFAGCTSLREAKFYSTLSLLASGTMFNGCTNLTDIYVPWAENEISGAPWGATNATIHYNTTYDENGNPIVAEE